MGTVLRALRDLGPSYSKDVTRYIGKMRGCRAGGVSRALQCAHRNGYVSMTEQVELPDGRVILPVWSLTEKGRAKANGGTDGSIMLPQALVLKAVHDLGITTLAEVGARLTEQGATVSHQNLENAMNRLHDGGYVERIPKKRRGMPNHWYITKDGDIALAEYSMLYKAPRKHRNAPTSAEEILTLIADGPQTVRQLMDRFDAMGRPISEYTLGKALERLCERKLVSKGHAPTVKIRNMYTITEAGRRALEDREASCTQ